MSIRIEDARAFALTLRTRMPFRYGIAQMVEVPHVFAQVTLAAGATRATGLAADHLPPKWFTKNPDTSPADDIAEMVAVIQHALRLARAAPPGTTVFDLWQQLYHDQRAWGDAQGYPPLLSGFGASLVERALIDAYCKATGVIFAESVRANALGIRLGDIYPDLSHKQPADYLPAQPLAHITVRHTVGLSDPLTDAEIPDSERLDDGLPQSLAACIRAYGLSHFKLKLCGEPAKDLDRLTRIVAILEDNAPADYAFTLDGNEMYQHVAPFREFWRALTANARLAPFLRRLLFVEQPLHRSVALSDEARAAFGAWPDRPPLIIDESDGPLDTLALALDCGYHGTSHKNCKGVFKGIANACLIERRRQSDPGAKLVISAEDLSNVGPVALLQDLAVVATLGIPHAERNGHHYFAGLSMAPAQTQVAVLQAHPDLYRRHEQGFPTLDIQGGQISARTVTRAPFGTGFSFDPAQFTPLDDWQSAAPGL